MRLPAISYTDFTVSGPWRPVALQVDRRAFGRPIGFTLQLPEALSPSVPLAGVTSDGSWLAE